jgi:parallel beta-helix repeat protein
MIFWGAQTLDSMVGDAFLSSRERRMKGIVSWMMLALLLLGMLTLAFNVGLVRAQAETVYINGDGSVFPYSAPISSLDNVTYTFTGNISYPIYYGIVIEKSNIVIDGNGYTAQGNHSGNGLNLTDTNNVTIKNTGISTFSDGILLNSSSNSSISGNNITNNNIGIATSSSSNSSISGIERIKYRLDKLI